MASQLQERFDITPFTINVDGIFFSGRIEGTFKDWLFLCEDNRFKRMFHTSIIAKWMMTVIPEDYNLWDQLIQSIYRAAAAAGIALNEEESV